MNLMSETPAQRVRGYLLADSVWAAAVAILAARGASAYAVGGVVRDALLGRESYDLDLAIEGSATDAARALADGLGGAVFVMDAERDVARVLLGHGDQARQIDLAGLRAVDIEADLRARDFTVNALALAVAPWGAALLDPTGGLDDLAQGVVRQTFAGALYDDPVRLLRLVRLRGLLGFDVDAATEREARVAAPLLAQVAPERIRDEVFNLLALDDGAAAWRYAENLGLLPQICGQQPPPTQWIEALRTLTCLTCWQRAVEHGVPGTPLRPYGDALAAYWAKGFTAGRPRGLLARLALLLPGCAPDEVGQRAWLRRLRLSGRETAHLRSALAAREALTQGLTTDALSLHRYFRACGAAGVDGAILHLAQAAAHDAGSPLPVVQAVLDAWFAQYDRIVAPTPLLSGDELLQTLQLTPGPQIGALLAAVREAQVLGEVYTAGEALALAAHLANEGDGA